MTLIETAVGLALLGSLLVAILMAKGRYTHQWTRANVRMQAVSAANTLLTKWWTTPESLPKSGSGHVERSPFVWRISRVANHDLDPLGAEMVRLEIVEDKPENQSPVRVLVDVVIPADPAKATPSESRP